MAGMGQKHPAVPEQTLAVNPEEQGKTRTALERSQCGMLICRLKQFAEHVRF